MSDRSCQAKCQQAKRTGQRGDQREKGKQGNESQADHFYCLYGFTDGSIHASHVFYVAAPSRTRNFYEVVSRQ